uniref:Uncharacterized protein n=1 Tax=Kalanchoe fedtschenkoi TaxID=63787 RepID=A0A7N0RAI8_KALFE
MEDRPRDTAYSGSDRTLVPASRSVSCKKLHGFRLCSSCTPLEAFILQSSSMLKVLWTIKWRSCTPLRLY